MTDKRLDPDTSLNDAIRTAREDKPESGELRAAADHIWARMQASATGLAADVEQIHGCEDVQRLLPAYQLGRLSRERTLLIDAHLHECAVCRQIHQQKRVTVDWTAPQPNRPGFRYGWATAAATVVIALAALVIYNLYFVVPAGARGRLQSVDGFVYRATAEGEFPVKAGDELSETDTLHTAPGSHAFIQLRDGSVVEVNERSELGLMARGRDLTITLHQGAVIVQAQKRRTGHLYVKTPDCRVAVTGTIFSVNSGMKGSRVAVIAGMVRVSHAGEEEVLSAGQQMSTSDNLQPVAVNDEIAWSHNLPQHLEALAQIAQLQRRLEQVPMPAPRYSSDILDRVPADTVLYISIPNLGETLSEANRIIQDQVQQSEALRQWWGTSNPQKQQELNELVEKLRGLSGYLGNEVVIVGTSRRGESGAAVVADVGRSGLQDFLNTQFVDPKNGPAVLAVDEHAFLSLTPASAKGKLIALVRPDVVIFSSDLEAIGRLNAELTAGTSGFTNTEFGRRIQDAYGRGAGFLIAANLHQMIADSQRPERKAAQRKGNNALLRSGFADMQYLIAEHREINGQPDNHLVLDFSGDRKGIASWLAAPAPMGSLEFVSPNAGLVTSVVTKDPKLIFDDIYQMMSAEHAHAGSDLAREESKLQLSVRNDLAAHFGGDATFALDGPMLPTPAWKFAVEVYDPTQLQASLEKLIAAGNEEARRHDRPEMGLESEEIGGQRYYVIRNSRTGNETHYTYAFGYMILGPSRAVVMDSVRTYLNGDSLASSATFKARLPKDENANYSAIVYQNLSPMLQPLLSQLNGQEAEVVKQLAGDARPTVICAWGKQDRIEAAGDSRLFGFDWLTLMAILNPGTKHAAEP